MCIVSFKKINLNSKFRNGRFTKSNLQYTMFLFILSFIFLLFCLFIPNNICKNILITLMFYKIEFAINLDCEFTYFQIKKTYLIMLLYKYVIICYIKMSYFNQFFLILLNTFKQMLIVKYILNFSSQFSSISVLNPCYIPSLM